MGFERLEKNLIDIIKEEQAKLGFRKEEIRLYYPLISLNHFFEADDDVDEMQTRLEQFPEEVKKKLGDICVTKPFTPMELLARVNSQLRRYRRFMEKLGDKEKTQNIHVIGGLELDEERVEVRVDGELVKVTPMEYKILLLLMKNPGRVFSADEIYERVWNERAVNTDTIMVHVRNIREKIEINPKEPKYLKVVWGVGYKIEKQA